MTVRRDTASGAAAIIPRQPHDTPLGAPGVVSVTGHLSPLAWKEFPGPVIRKAGAYRIIDYSPRDPRYIAWWVPVLNQPSRIDQSDDLAALMAACEAHHASVCDLVARAEMSAQDTETTNPARSGV